MPKIVEYSYGKLFKYTMKAINPVKKAIITTDCKVHRAINIQALAVLKSDGKYQQFNMFSSYLLELNMGVVWADQDFKSSGHFYNPLKDRGLYGNTNALTLASNYYSFALGCYEAGDIRKSMFFLGAAAHLVQDVTVPQHANIKLLQEHHKFEKFVRDTFSSTPEYLVCDKGCYLEDIKEFIYNNAISAIKASKKLSYISDDEQRYYELTRRVLPLAQRSTAGLFYMFYRDVREQESSSYRSSVL